MNSILPRRIILVCNQEYYWGCTEVGRNEGDDESIVGIILVKFRKV